MALPDSSQLEYWEAVAKCGFIAVIVGVAGEGIELISKWLEYWRRKEFKAKTKIRLLTLESFFFAMVVIGLAVEFWGSQQVELIADSQNTKLEKLASETALQAQELRRENLLLEANIQPRRITPDQRLIILNELGKNLPPQRCRVLITFEDFDVEPRIFAQEIRSVLGLYFRNVEIQSQMVSFSGDDPPVTGVFLAAHNPPPPGAREILKAFIDAGVFRTNTVFDPAPDDGTLRISVWPKPLQ